MKSSSFSKVNTQYTSTISIDCNIDRISTYGSDSNILLQVSSNSFLSTQLWISLYCLLLLSYRNEIILQVVPSWGFLQ